MSDLEVDVAILGAGGAGSALLLALDRAWHHDPASVGLGSLPPRIVVIDPVAHSDSDRTWCFWHEGPHDLEAIAHRSWQLAEVTDPGGERVVLDLDPFRYLMLRSSDVYAHAHEASRRLGARWIAAAASDPAPVRDGAIVVAGDQRIRARWVFDSRPAWPRRRATTAWLQHFRGWTVRLPEPLIDVHVPVLMDLSTPQTPNAVTFGYVLPLEADLALVEFTVFSPASSGRWPTARYEDELRAYLLRRWGMTPAAVTIEAIEDGAIPMSDAGFQLRPARHVLRIGSAAGATRASTGYTFAAMYRQAVEVATALKEGRAPVPSAAYPRRHRVIDATLLTALDGGSVDGAELFGGLWLGQPPARLLRFLGGRSTLAEELAVMSAAPRLPMGRAAVRWATRRSLDVIRVNRGVTEM